MFLKAIEIQHREAGGRADDDAFPLNLPLIRSMERLALDKPVTMFVGENGTGKSTLLEGIAAAIGSITVGAVEVDDDASLAAARALARRLRLTWKVKTKKGFFLRAEDFLNFSRRIAAIRSEMLANIAEVEEEYKDRSAYARSLAMLPYRKSIAEMERLYGADLDARSHGESFLKLFGSRLVPGGLYLLDEPETPLSPMKQLSFLSMVKEMTAQNCQFLIATHSPILMACPDAAIYSFDEHPPRAAAYDELEHVRLTRDFLAEPGRFLRHL